MTVENIHHLPRLGMAGAMRLFGLTARALRFYDPAARRRLEWIARLRKAGVSLPDIEEVLHAEDDGACGRDCAVRKLEARREALASELARLETALTEFKTAPAAPAAPRRLGVTAQA